MANSLPVTLSLVRGGFHRVITKTGFECISAGWSSNDDGTYNLKINVRCQKVYDFSGERGTNSTMARYILTDAYGELVKNGIIHRSGLPCGYPFTETIDVYRIPRGDYYLELLDYD